MTVSIWLPTGLAAAAVTLASPFLIGALKSWIERSLQSQFDQRLEELRARLRREEEQLRLEIQSRDAQIEALRSGALSGMAARQSLLAERKLKACEALWSATVNLAPLKTASAATQVLKLEEMVARSEGESHEARKLQQFASMTYKSLGLEDYRYDPIPDRERPFVSPLTWSIFLAYRQVVSYPILMLATVKAGVGSGLIKSPPKDILELVKSVLPSMSDFVDKFGAEGLSHLVQQLEDRLIDAIRSELAGHVIDESAVAQAAEIVRRADAVSREMKPPAEGNVRMGSHG